MNDVVIRCLMLLVVAVISIFVGFYRHRGIQLGDPISFGTACLFFILYLLWVWKNNKVEFIKRCILAAPFAPLLAIAFRTVGFDMVVSIYAGIAVFLLLIMKAANWKQHFLIILTTVLVLTILLTYIRHSNFNEHMTYVILVIFCIALPFVVLYAAYLYPKDLQKTMELRPIAFKLVKFAGACFLALVLFIISHVICRYYQISFAISFMISVLIALGFLGLCKLFDIKHPVE